MKQLELYGDSILKGVTYAAEQNKYRLCHRARFDELEQQGIAVNNHSRMGATVEKGVSILEKHAPYADDTLVILEYGGNDCDFDWAEVAENPQGTFLPHTPEDAFVAKYRYAVETARERGAEVAMLSLIPIDAGKYFSWITREKNGDNILQWLGDVSMLSRWQEYYSRLVEDLAASLRCPLIDIRREFLLSHRFGDLLSADGIHPTQAGHDLIADRIAAYTLAAG